MQAAAPYEVWIQEAATQNGLRPDLLRALLRQESGFNPRAVSPAGAQGIAQIMPATGRAYGLQNPFDARESIFTGARILRDYTNQFGGSEVHGLAAYNRGPAGLRRDLARGTLAGETQNYVQRIMGPQALTQLTGQTAPAPIAAQDNAAYQRQFRALPDTRLRYNPDADNPDNNNGNPFFDEGWPEPEQVQTANPFDDRPPQFVPEAPAAQPVQQQVQALQEATPEPSLTPLPARAQPATPAPTRSRTLGTPPRQQQRRAAADYDSVLAALDERLFGVTDLGG